MEFLAQAAGTLNITERNRISTPEEISRLSDRIIQFRDSLNIPSHDSTTFPYSIAILPIALSHFVSIILHLPRSHNTNPKCPHWLACLEIVKQAIPTLQPLFHKPSNLNPHNPLLNQSLSNNLPSRTSVTHSFSSLSLYLIA